MVYYFYDIVLLVIIIASIVNGYKKGLLCTVLSIICFIIALTCATIASSNSVVSYVYDTYLQSAVSSTVEKTVDKAKEKAIEHIKETIAENVPLVDAEDLTLSEDTSDLIKKLLGYIDFNEAIDKYNIVDKVKTVLSEHSAELTDSINDNLPFIFSVTKADVEEAFCTDEAASALIYEIIGEYTNYTSEETMAEYLERTVVAPVIKRVLEAVLFSLTFLIVSVILKAISKVFLSIKSVKPVKKADSFFGAIFGVLKGVGISIVIVCVVYFIITLSNGIEWMNEDIIANTVVFKYVYYPIINWIFI